MKNLVFGESGFVNKAEELFNSEKEVAIVINGWRKKLLLPYVRELIATSHSGDELTNPKFGYIVRLPWLGPLMVCYGLALERKMYVKIIETEDKRSATLIFSTE